MFSSRLPSHLTVNAVTGFVHHVREAGGRLDDLTETNPTSVGLPVDREILRALGDPAGAVYRPEPLGLLSARAAVAASYRHRAAVGPEQVVLTASTSEAYAFLFKLLCDPGDDVLVPQPSYPLFDLLAGLEGVAIAPYRLDPVQAWAIDRGHLQRARSSRTRAVLVVSPNNPTGSLVQEDDRAWLSAWAASYGLAIIADEVFADYLIAPRRGAVSFAGHDGALTFTLGGLSKSAALPQMKLAWTIVSGPGALVQEALERLALIADTYLSVSTPVQVALPALLERGGPIRREVSRRVAGNLAVLRAAVRLHPAVTLLEPEGGWSAVLRVPATVSEEALVLRAVRDAGVLVHPGYFFDFPDEAYLVVSLLPDAAMFAAAVTRLLSVVDGVTAS